MGWDALIARAFEVFPSKQSPAMTLRGGDQVDAYEEPPPYDEKLDAPSDEYVAEFAYYALFHLDSESLKYYLPYLMRYAHTHMVDASAMAIDALLRVLQREPGENGSLSDVSEDQEHIIREFVEALATDERSSWQFEATQVLKRTHQRCSG